jgi:hypothetical protein
MEETARAAREGLDTCSMVYVCGVDSLLGPFLADSAVTVDRLVGREPTWKIEAAPGTLLGDYSRTSPPEDGRWIYIDPATDWTKLADCRLSFDPVSIEARWEKRGR